MIVNVWCMRSCKSSKGSRLVDDSSLPLERLERLRKVIRDRGGELQEIDGPKELEGLSDTVLSQLIFRHCGSC